MAKRLLEVRELGMSRLSGSGGSNSNFSPFFPVASPLLDLV